MSLQARLIGCNLERVKPKGNGVTCIYWSKDLSNSRSFQRSIDHGPFSIELHTWQTVEKATFATFIYEKADERLFRKNFTDSDQNEVIRQALKWCEENA
jgi:hypothetical protein